MLSSCSSNAILAKIRAILGRRLTAADYAQMARRRDVGEVAALLKATPSYAGVLRHIEESAIHRGQLEALLKKDLFYQYSNLRRYDFSGKDFYDFAIVQVEIREILRRIILLQSGEQTDFVVDLPSYMLGRTSFPVMDLARTRTVAEMIDCMPHTPYPAILSRFAGQDIRSIRILDCEYALYSYYYRYLTDTIRSQFSGSTRKELLEVVSSEIEAVNIQTIFRMKLYFHASSEQIRAHLYPYAWRLKKNQMEALLAAEDFAGMCRALTPDGGNVSEEDGIELFINRNMAHLEQKQLRFTTSAPVAMYTFLTLRRIEVQNIITVIEGVRYQLPQEEILAMLIL